MPVRTPVSQQPRSKALITKIGEFRNNEPVGWQFADSREYITVHDTMGTTIINGYTILELRKIYANHMKMTQ